MRIKLASFKTSEWEGEPNYFEKAGDTIPIHKHPCAHLHIADGPIEARCGEETKRLAAWEPYEVPAGTEHSLTALADNIHSMCLFAKWGADGYRHDPKGAAGVQIGR